MKLPLKAYWRKLKTQYHYNIYHSAEISLFHYLADNYYMDATEGDQDNSIDADASETKFESTFITYL